MIWGLLRPKCNSSCYKTIIVCTFYSPPNRGKNSKMADHIVTTLHMLNTRYPDSGIIIGADKNDMDIRPLLNCGLKLKQIVDKPTRKDAILDIILMNLGQHYKSPRICPPICPDDPSSAMPSDHSVPVCTPHTDRYTRPVRQYRSFTFRPLPESGIRRFGEWITRESWGRVTDATLSPTEQVAVLENVVKEKLDKFCPTKTVRLGPHDKPWITAEIKQLQRQKLREYRKNSKSLKYRDLLTKFRSKYKNSASKYLRKHVDELKKSKPGQVFRILKRMGAQPGDCSDEGTFTLPGHLADHLSDQQSAERIADHFAEISGQFLPLDISRLTDRVKIKLNQLSTPPIISEFDVYQTINKAKKPKGSVPGDLPRELVREFGPELAAPITSIIQNAITSAQWPDMWKVEYVTPLAKIPLPVDEDDLRPISLTNFFSKVMEHFVFNWLLDYIGHLIDFRQYGGMRGNSICHYLIELISFILMHQDSTAPTAILACMVDFSKAFNRQDHTILITKLSDLGVPAWLLKIVMSFLTSRSMFVRYKGTSSSSKDLPGGGPQGTLLGLLLFLVLINDLGFEDQKNNIGELLTSKKKIRAANEIHLKYIDDLTIAEAIKLKDLPTNPADMRPQPDNYHARTGHFLPPDKSTVAKKLYDVETYANEHLMKLNNKKTKLMLFNSARNYDFISSLKIGDDELETVETMRLLGVVLRSDLKWSTNTHEMTGKGYKKLWILKRLKCHGASKSDLLEVYKKQVRPTLEFAAPVWHPAITLQEKEDIGRVQKTSAKIILQENYSSYKQALTDLEIDTLEDRRLKLCTKFALKAEESVKFSTWFQPNSKTSVTRQKPEKYCPVLTRTVKLEKSPISYLTDLLNQHHHI